MNGIFNQDIFSKNNVLVIGDVMLDRYQWGEVKRISPEAPVPVVKVLGKTEVPGGAGNVALNLSGLGCPVCLIALCGADEAGDRLKQILDAKGINTVFKVDASRLTTTKTRVMANNQQLFRLDEEKSEQTSPAISQEIIKHFKENLPSCRAVVMSDYGKGVLSSPEVCEQIISMCKNAKIQVVVDPKGRDWERYRGVTCVTPNTTELELASGSETEGNEQALLDCAKYVKDRFGLENLLVTRGPEGMCLVMNNNEIETISAESREVFDVSGAGDTVIATLAAGLAAGFSIFEAARIANTAAGIVVGKLGTQPVTFSELDMAFGRNGSDKNAAKIFTLDAALIQIQAWRAAGKKIVFTNGCFDLLHPGHIDLLNQASSFGDCLIIGLNTDASVKRLKGGGRPILNEHDRAAILGALESVNMVVLFDEDTPLALIKALSPDILVKGADYRPEEVAGRDIVESYGGELRLVKLLEGYSTTRIADRFP
ncbi:MAG: bifunctional D-glycero-beta-D-manno-heptose-7-phosphate kinase/D-glycero-beta-D-manno-heptose 1-phosphate adenylyltransferase HldE [Deltaproteobacteria bacterium]|nr:bifunctional D-glycero-beta-D-manno-heptose-7-phosphate kinase/D-glycero-beta-D-manno-heptose 1-phosphate adenylyltransferase HldE [Deltaproteobacteria bacterium]MBW2218563.1 bifunctional D-glycero-beta-D-manno-heptose-7-phosphate kinase/D-glycero-beta-D-manno-heptose 1-phosphate adenylyltransferase HldE [Deltaproteobacteria bacterium]